MDYRWTPINQDSKREVKVILHPTAAIWDVRRGEYTTSDDSIDLSPYVSTCTQTAFDCNVTLKFNRELFGNNQPKPNQVLEIQLKQKGAWLPLWLGHIDAINSYTMQRGERSMQLIAKTREQQDIWKSTKRVTPLFPQMTNLSYIIQRIARTAGMQHDEVVLLPTSMTTPHSNTQLADMTAWDMIQQVCVPLGWTPFIDNIGRLRVADRGLQGRVPDAELTDDRMVKVTGSRMRSPVSRVRVAWLNPTLKMNRQMAKQLNVATITIGWFMPVFWKHIDFSTDKTQRATDTYFKPNPGVNRLHLNWTKEKWTQQSPTGGRLFFDNTIKFALMVVAVEEMIRTAGIPDNQTVRPVEVGGVFASTGSTVDGTPPNIPVGGIQRNIAMALFMLQFVLMGTGNYEIWGNPYEWVHARNISEAFDSSVPSWVDNGVDIETDFIVNEEHAKATAIRELIYQARSANKWSVTIVDDPRVEFGDILKFPDGSQIYVEDFSRNLERGAEATLDIKGFLVGPVRGAGGTITGEVPNLPAFPPGEGFPGSGTGGPPTVGGGTPGSGGGDSGYGEGTMPNYRSIVDAVAARYTMIVPAGQQEQGKAQFTRLVAWEIYSTTDTNIGLLKKTGGTQVMNLSVDKLVKMTDGSFADMCTDKAVGDGTYRIQPMWLRHDPDKNTIREDHWIVPTADYANAPGPLTLV